MTTALFLIALSAAAWLSLLVLARVLRRPFEPRAPVPWSGWQLLGCLLMLLAAHLTVPLVVGDLSRFMGAARGEAELSLHQGRVMLGGSAVANLAASALAAGWLAIAARARAGDLGFDTSRLGSDLRWGVSVFLALVIPIYLLQALLSSHIAGEHPIETVLRKHPDAVLRFLAVAAAVIAAPLSEELFFRVLLQGWLEKLWTRRGSKPASELLSGDELVIDVNVTPAANENPYAAPVAEPILATDISLAAGRSSWTPIIACAAIFAALHVGNGPDPIPLFFLSLVLGYQYQRTHRIWPSLVVHVCLNAASMTMLLVDVSR